VSTTLQATEVDDRDPVRTWSVEESGWKQLLPDLPDDVIALLATPVVVSAESLGGQRRPERAGRPRRFPPSADRVGEGRRVRACEWGRPALAPLNG